MKNCKITEGKKLNIKKTIRNNRRPFLYDTVLYNDIEKELKDTNKPGRKKPKEKKAKKVRRSRKPRIRKKVISTFSMAI